MKWPRVWRQLILRVNTRAVVEFLTIDGSYGEGGGQILRTSVTLSALTKKPIEIVNIRAKRGNPGLRPQHVNAINALAALCRADVENVRVGSDKIRFSPGEMQGGYLKIDVGTAGSVTLILQAVIPAVSLSAKRATIEARGGTDVPWSPTLDYLRYVVRPAFKMVGIDFSIDIQKRGYYPVGGGIVRTTVEPCEKPDTLDLIKAPRIEPVIVSVCGSLPSHVAQRQVAAALAKLQKDDVECKSYSASVEQSSSPGSSILVYCASGFGPLIGADAIGARGKRAEEVGAEATEKFLVSYKSNAAVDEHLADMLVVPLCLVPGRSQFLVNRETQHLTTNLYVTSKVVGCKYDIKRADSNYLVTIEGSTRDGMV
jgi:RNA 3'-terminal phosphate cyclase (ATP)